MGRSYKILTKSQIKSQIQSKSLSESEIKSKSSCVAREVRGGTKHNLARRGGEIATNVQDFKAMKSIVDYVGPHRSAVSELRVRVASS